MSGHANDTWLYILDLYLANLETSSVCLIFRYEGSLTAPPCTENVQWTIIKRTLGIRLKELDQFRRLRSTPKPSANGFELPPSLANNYRPVQKWNADKTKNPGPIIYENSDKAPESPMLGDSDKLVSENGKRNLANQLVTMDHICYLSSICTFFAWHINAL